MKYWQRGVAIGAGVLASLWSAGTALAQGPGPNDGIVPALRDVLVNVAGRMDAKLGTWVVGNELTDPQGKAFVHDLASFIHQVVSYISQALWDLLVQLHFV